MRAHIIYLYLIFIVFYTIILFLSRIPVNASLIGPQVTYPKLIFAKLFYLYICIWQVLFCEDVLPFVAMQNASIYIYNQVQYKHENISENN